MPELQILMTGIVFGEQPRWHDGRLWFSDWGTQEVIAVDLEGNSEVVLKGSSFPLCVDWLPDGRLLVVSSREGLLLSGRRSHSSTDHAQVGASGYLTATTSIVRMSGSFASRSGATCASAAGI
jgi:sugar lactone lactonase YvrE